ncbi:hypothetical protein ASG01_13760 [Chryseobacterium sp. Leaf180]|uniref:hypothetical protein n=1 Tax=Chryseobacterium sp. Leaf180 TaxID=1736289 RepID=UPI0006F298D6|nr:hypothetical protein [Chryseobacterium sp. Leaf180]KQR91436.1 hypothetical protein ASG01_13760 [Chryseobacterium sp. Leaf180]
MENLFRKFVILSLLTYTAAVFAQVSFKRLNDPAIVAQHRRMVFQSWGDWRPYPKYFLGVQTNFAYATVWGLWSTKINRDYKDGEDIRPLKPTGIQNQRLAQLKLQEEEALRIKASSDTIRQRSIHDLLHWTSATVDADPLWLLYYKRMLKHLYEFPDHPQNFYEWKLKDHDTFKTLTETGAIARLQEELDLIKEKYRMSRTMDMPRGKRFLMYHETLVKWRRFEKELRGYNDRVTLLTGYKTVLKSHSDNALSSSWYPESDQQVVRKMMQHFKHRY